MTIVIICDYGFIKGGDSKVAILSAKALKARGYEVIFFTAVGPVDPELINIGIEVICTDQFDILSNPSKKNAIIQGIRNKTAQKKLQDLLSRLDKKSTIIHIHSVVKALSPAIYDTIIYNNFRLATTLHDYFLACPNGSFFDYGTDKICTVKALSSKCFIKNCDSRNYSHKLWRFSRTLIQKYYYKIPKRIHNFISISDLSTEVLKKYLPVNSNIFRVNNPVDLTKEDPIKISPSSHFAFIGRMSREKGIELLAEASECLNTEVLFIGDGPYAATLQKNYPKVNITGWKNKGEIASLFKNIRAIVYPSLWFEVQPLVVLESLAMGIPVIVPDTSASKELIQDGQTGLLFKGGSKQDLIEKFEILEDDSVATRMGENAYNTYWAAPFTIDAHIDELLKVYNRILK